MPMRMPSGNFICKKKKKNFKNEEEITLLI